MNYAEKIDYYAHLNDMPTFGNANGKTGRGCFTWSMPAGVTCNPAAPCCKEKYCYCLKGRQMFPTVRGSYYKNLRLYNEDPDGYFEKCFYILKYSGIKLCRINDSGDIPDAAYFVYLIRTAEKLPDIRFLLYTKKYEIINDYLDAGGIIPENLTVRFSYLSKEWIINNPHNLPAAYIDFKDAGKNPDFPAGAFLCRGNSNAADQEHTCAVCQACFKKNIQAVIFKQH